MPLSFHLHILLLLLFSTLHVSLAGILADPVTTHGQPLKPGDYSVPAYPTQTQAQICRLDLSAELFGGVNEACGHNNLDRSRCCPVLAAWLFAAHATSALQLPSNSSSSPSSLSDQPMMPDDSQKCVNSLQTSLLSRNIKIPQPNATCDAILCFCGIRLHQISSLSCPAAFNVSGFRNATPTAAVHNLERNCRNSTYSGCTKCLGALQKLKGGTSTGKNVTANTSERASKMFGRDCQLMGLTWLLAKNKTAYIPTVSAVLRALMYSARSPHDSTCSSDQENMPLAVDSLEFENYSSSSPASVKFMFPVMPLIMVLMSLFV